VLQILLDAAYPLGKLIFGNDFLVDDGDDPIDQGLSTPVRVGAVVALPLGGGGGKPFVGGVGTPEMRERFSETTYEVAIGLDNGGYTMVQRADGASFRVGDRVRVQGTELELLGN